MTKEEEFVERFGMVLRRFKIEDRFRQLDSNIAKLTITRQAYQILHDMVEEANKNGTENNTDSESSSAQLQLDFSAGETN